MSETTTFGYQEGSENENVHLMQSDPALSAAAAQLKFSPEELRVLAECNRESFFKRSLPIGIALGTTTFIALQKGHLKPNPRFGVFPKVTLAVVMGYFIGKLSYQEACAEKLMALPGSYVGQLLRDRKEGRSSGRGPMQLKSPTMFGAGPSDIYSDAGPGNALDLDTDRPVFNDNDTYRADNNSEHKPSDVPSAQSALTYDELRRRNRGDHANNKQDPYRLDPGPIPPISRRPPPPQSPATNKYGDDME